MAFENRQEEGVFNLRKKGKTSSVDWTKLPSELLVEIIEKHLVSSIDDYAAVSSVCRSWRKAAVDGCDRERLRQIWGGRQMPWLLLTDGNQEILNIDGPYARLPSLKKQQRHHQTRKRKRKRKRKTSRSRSVLNLVKNKKYKVNFPQGYGRSCWGSSHGWILTHDIDTRNMYLFNPLTKTRLDLPCETTFPKRRYLDNYFVDKVAIFKDNHTGGLLVVLVYHTNIAFAKPGDAEWSEISTRKDCPHTRIEDVLYRVVDGDPTLFFMDYRGDLAYYRLDHHQQQQPKLTWYHSKLELLHQFWSSYPCEYSYNEYSYNEYLVNSPSGENLLTVLRLIKFEKPEFARSLDPETPDYDQDKIIIGNYKTVDFKVYKFLFDANRWEEVEDLQDVSIFVGNNAAMSVSATHSGCQPNCIYFTDDNKTYYSWIPGRLGGHDMGVFRIKDKAIMPFDVHINDALTRSSYCCPLWFCPAL